MAFQFPANPTLLETVVNPITGSTYQWRDDLSKWILTRQTTEISEIIWEGDSPPNPVGDYKLWYSTDTLELYFYYCDSNGVCSWVPTSVPITMLEDLDSAVFELRQDLTAVNVAVKENENQIGRTIYFGDKAPTIYPDVVIDGVAYRNELNYKFWYDDSRLELLILFRDADGDDSYVPVSISLKGEVLKYTFDNNIGTLVTTPGRIGSNSGFWSGVNKFSFGTEDADGITTPTMFNGQTIETYSPEENKTNLYKITNASGAPTEVEVNYISGDLFYVPDMELYVYIRDELDNYVKKTGGDEMEGPFKVTGNPEIPGSRDSRRIETLGVFSGTASSALRLGTNRDRVYIGDSDTSFNGLVKVDEIGEKSAGNSIKFKNDIKMGQHQIHNLAEATADTDAVTYGQIKRELTEKFEEITADISQGTYRSVTDADPLTAGNFTTRSGSTGGAYNNITAQLTQLRFNKKAEDGSSVDFSQLNAGDYIRIAKSTDIWQFRVDATPTLDGTTNYYIVNVTRPSGPDFITTGEDYQISFLTFGGGTVDLDEYVKKAGDTMTGELKIQQTAEAKLTLQGSRTNTTNSVATVSFLNSSVPSDPGYLTYRSDGTNSPFFKFNESLDLNNKQIKHISSVNFGNVGTVKANDNQKMVIRNAGNANDGNGNVEIERPPNSRRGFTIRGNDETATETDILYSYTNASGGDAINYVGKMSGAANILNRAAIEELIAAGGSSGGAAGENFVSHGPWQFAGTSATVNPGQWTTDAVGLKQIRQITFHNRDINGEDISWSDLQVGEVITIVQQGDFTSANGVADGWAIVNYEVTGIDTQFSAVTIIDVSAHWSVLVFSNGQVQYNPNENWGFLTDTDTYVLESQPATLNNIVQMAKKTSAGPAFNVYRMSANTSEGLVGIGKGYFISNGNLQTPTKFIFSSDDWYGNGHKWGANIINCPNSNLEFYRKNADGTLCLCRVYRFNDIQSYGTGAKFEIRNITPVYTATGGTSTIPSPGVMETGENYLVRFKLSLGTVPYTIDGEEDTHWGFHRLEDVGEPVDASDASTKNYVDDRITELLAKIEELEMASGATESYQFRMYNKTTGSSTSIGPQINTNQIMSCNNDGDNWYGNNTHLLSSEYRHIYVCFQDGYQLNSTGQMSVVTYSNSNQYDVRNSNVATFNISGVEVCPPNKSSGKNIYRAVIQLDAYKPGASDSSYPSWGEGYLYLTFSGGSLTKVS